MTVLVTEVRCFGSIIKLMGPVSTPDSAVSSSVSPKSTFVCEWAGGFSESQVGDS